MSQAQLEIQLIAVTVAVACAIPGVFLVLRRLALLSDAISHAILFGIVIAFLVVHDLSSPFLVLAATLTGVLTVSLVSLINRTGLVREDASIGLVFPVLFSIGVILISRYAGNVHLDTDAVLLGELAFAPFNRFTPFGQDIGPKALYVMAGILVLNILFISLFYKELKLATFDAGLAAALSFSPALLHYTLMTLVSVTAVGAFDAVGSILVVALMIAPPAAAYLLTDRLALMIVYSAILAALSAIAGYWVAHALDASIAGSMASLAGIIFGVVFLTAPNRGILAQVNRRLQQRWEFAQTMLAIHLANHEGTPREAEESFWPTLHEHLRWERQFLERVVHRAEKHHLVRFRQDHVSLTDQGRQVARHAIIR